MLGLSGPELATALLIAVLVTLLAIAFMIGFVRAVLGAIADALNIIERDRRRQGS